MKSKFNYLIGVSLKRKLCTKWFLIVNAILLLAIVAITNVDRIIGLFGGDFSSKQQIYIVDNTNYSYDIFKNQLMISTSSTEENMNYNLELLDKNEEEIKELLSEEEDALVIIFEEDIKDFIKVKLISESYIDILNSQYIQNAIYNTKVNLAIQNSNIDVSVLENIYKEVSIERVILDESKNSASEEIEVVMTTVFPIVILPFFMLIVYLIQMIGAEINDEKTTRGMEIIISSVSPSTHFFSKVVSSNLFVILQGVLLILYGVIGLFIRKLIGGNDISLGFMGDLGFSLSNVLDTAFVDKLIYIIPITLLLMLLTFLSYSLVAGILASMTTNVEDYQQVQTPIVIVLLIAYYLAILASTFKGSLFIKVLAVVPFISAILSPSLLVLGQIGIFEIILAVIINLVVIYFLIKYGLRVYKVGILNYSSNKMWSKMFKALKNK